MLLYIQRRKSDKASEGFCAAGCMSNLQSDEAIEMDLVYLTYRAEREHAI